uniref:Uncharacterized protein n=1 Tax=Parascaris univalens TaxID=6257 RepID=A0A915AAX1_PARUN
FISVNTKPIFAFTVMRARLALQFASIVVMAVSVFRDAIAIPTGDRLWSNGRNGDSEPSRVELSGKDTLDESPPTTRGSPQHKPIHMRKGFHVLATVAGVYLLVSLLLTPLLLSSCACRKRKDGEVVEKKVEKGGETTTEEDRSAYR